MRISICEQEGHALYPVSHKDGSYMQCSVCGAIRPMQCDTCNNTEGVHATLDPWQEVFYKEAKGKVYDYCWACLDRRYTELLQDILWYRVGELGQ